MLKNAFRHGNKMMAQAFEEGRGLTLYCKCGAGLRQVPKDKIGCSVRRRCPECKQRWKLTIHREISDNYKQTYPFAAEFEQTGMTAAPPKKKLQHKKNKPKSC